MAQFNYGVCGKEPDDTEDLLFEPSLQCFAGRSSKTAAAGDTCQVGGHEDFFDVSGAGPGTFIQRPVRKVFFGREVTNYQTDDVEYALRIEYDIVTLTTSEQAELYQAGLCS